ncbi:amino acid permease/transporter [Novymonas esmeraldas]|uniref:Amino acid permease/transporter n=1 Tax=Novymonas esmeraldas TaxID=1808958 RepID=A0AAW0EML6_9TRYP
MDKYGPNQIVRQFYEHPPRSHLYRPASADGDHLITGATPADGAAAPPRRAAGEEDAAAASTDASTDRGSPLAYATKTDGASMSEPSLEEAAPPQRRTLSTLLLTGLMYTFTISGAYGIEESVMGGGALLTIVCILVFPVIMGAPTALVVAELGSAVPSNAGFLMWIKLSFHRTVYLSMAIMSLIYIAVDNALYPAMFSEYFCSAVSCSDTEAKCLRVGMLLVTYVLNMLGVEAVGVASVVLTVLTAAPFLLMFLQQQLTTGFYVNWPAVATIPKSVRWTTFISTASWCLSGLEQAGAVVEEVEDPQRTLIGSLIPLMGLAVITYVPPILTGASISTGPIDLSEWTTGYWTQVSFQVGGDVLKFITVAGGILSAFGLSLSALCTTTRIISGMALTEAFPGEVGVWLSRRNMRFGTYHWTLTLNTILTGIFSTVLGFGVLVQVDQCIYGIRVIAIIISFYRFRTLYPHLPRPFRIPFGGWRLHLMMGVALASSAALVIISLCEETLTVVLCAAVVGGSCLASLLYCHFVRRHDFAGRIVTFVALSSSDGHRSSGGDADADADADATMHPTQSDPGAATRE